MYKQWKSVVGTNGFYEVSDCGDVRSVARCVKKTGVGRHCWPSKNLKPNINTCGYKYVNICLAGNIKSKEIHGLVWGAFMGERPHGYMVDHIDRDKTNNKLENLRLATNAQNIANRGKRRRAGHPERKYKGVRKRKNGRFSAAINKGKNSYFLGVYDCEEDAAKAYDVASRHFWGDFAYQNMPL